MAAHFRTLAWQIPQIEKAGGLESMGSQRPGHGLEGEHAELHVKHYLEYAKNQR